MKYCPICGTQNADDAVQCSACGRPFEQQPQIQAPVQEVEPAPEVQSSPVEPFAQQQVVPGAEQQVTYQQPIQVAPQPQTEYYSQQPQVPASPVVPAAPAPKELHAKLGAIFSLIGAGCVGISFLLYTVAIMSGKNKSDLYAAQQFFAIFMICTVALGVAGIIFGALGKRSRLSFMAGIGVGGGIADLAGSWLLLIYAIAVLAAFPLL